jgi:hypothetical protein
MNVFWQLLWTWTPLALLVLVVPLTFTWTVTWCAKSIMREYFKLRGEKK